VADRPDAVIASPLPGNLRIGLRFGEKGLVSIDFLPADTPLRQSRDPAIQSVVEQLEMFFRDGKERFDVALDLHGTVFQQRVWRALIR
jgi:O6-methylguanine-DNA--protein-cysteine methyltransferase